MPNLTTSLAITVFTPAVAGCLLLLSWLQHRRIVALGVWGFGFCMASIATTLIVVARGAIPDFWSIVVGNALLAAAYRILWCGARKFEGKNVSIVLALAGVLLWLAACSIGPIYARPEARATVMAAIGICYTLLAVFELWRGVAMACGAGRSCCCSSRMPLQFLSTFRSLGRGNIPILPTWIY